MIKYRASIVRPVTDAAFSTKEIEALEFKCMRILRDSHIPVLAGNVADLYDALVLNFERLYGASNLTVWRLNQLSLDTLIELSVTDVSTRHIPRVSNRILVPVLDLNA
jgi:hypothetical protein